MTPGIPWDNRRHHGTLAAAWETCRLVLTAPAAFFTRMRTRDGHASPILFCLLLNFIGALFAGIWSLAISPEVTEQAIAETLPASLNIDLLGGPAGLHRIMLAVSVVVGPLVSVIGVYLWAGMMFLMLRILQVDGRDFHTTLRIAAYANTMQLALLLPMLGGFFALAGTLVIMIIGIRTRNGIGGGKAGFIVTAFPLAILVFSMILLGSPMPGM
jgi:hypothetical protein